MSFRAERVTYTYADSVRKAVDAVSVTISAGELVAVVGPNGSGKTTLMRLLLGVCTPSEGLALAFDRPASAWNRRELARRVGVVSQREEPAFPLRVEHAVMFGRYPHLGALAAPQTSDHAAVDRALARCDVSELRKRWISTLSGGEWQRVRVARALAQEPQALVLDEATANLDVRHEMEVFELVAQLVREERLAGLLVTHHVNLAARFADTIVVMDAGTARAVGPPRDVLSEELLRDVFAWPVDVTDWRGIPQFVPLRTGEEPTSR